jgi:hypothetical protein
MSNDLAKQPALRRWQESVYGKGPHQVPDYESMAAIVQEHEQMASRIEELEAKAMKASYAAFLEKRRTDEAQDKLARALRALERIELSTNTREQGGIAMATLAELKREDRG